MLSSSDNATPVVLVFYWTIPFNIIILISEATSAKSTLWSKCNGATKGWFLLQIFASLNYYSYNADDVTDVNDDADNVDDNVDDDNDDDDVDAEARISWSRAAN